MVGTMTLFFQVVGFSHAVVLAPLTRCFPNITKSYNFRLSVFLPSVLYNSLHSMKNFMKCDALSFFQNLSKYSSFFRL